MIMILDIGLDPYRVEQSAHYPPVGAQADMPTAMRWMWRGYKL